MTLCYMKVGLVGPVHVLSLWTRLSSERGTGRYSDKMLTYQSTPKQWLHNLAPIAQVKLWNGYLNDGMETVVSTTLFKQVTKRVLLDKYCDTLKEQGFDIE